MGPPRRGVQDIRTYAGRSTSPGSNQKRFARLSALEMERVRRMHEYETAQARADIARERVQKLAAEINEIVREVSGHRESQATGAKGGAMIDPERVAIKHAYGVTGRAVKQACTETKEPAE
ncbi:MAG: hypothetical protein AAFN41_09665 [Planctomycetota bacterium]